VPPKPSIGQWVPLAVILTGYVLGNCLLSRGIAPLIRRIDELRAVLLKSEVKRMKDRFERLEHPLVRKA
jgi:hypothetical protein